MKKRFARIDFAVVSKVLAGFVVLLVIGGVIVALGHFDFVDLGSGGLSQYVGSQPSTSPNGADQPTPSVFLPLVHNSSLPDLTSGWVTYSNNLYTLRYPPNMEVTERGNTTYFSFRGSTQRQGQEFHDGLIIAISIDSAETGSDWRTQADRQISRMQVPNSSVQIKSEEALTVGDYKAVQVIGSELGSKFVRVFIPHGEHILDLKTNYGGKQEQEYLQLFHGILSSLELQ